MFPSELASYSQWVCWRSELTDEGKPTKRPYNPRTGKLASPTNPNDWSDYQTAVAAASNGGNYSGIGFVFTDNDPYCGIDLDDPQGNPELIKRQTAIANAFDTYSELSPSGKGLHLICKAKIFGGRRRDKIEIYSSQRYFTITGNTYQDKPINERNMLANMLWDELGNDKIQEIDLKIVSFPQEHSDDIIKDVAAQADNGQKFLELYEGHWTKYYESHSQADIALINILGFYSRNVAQIRRMFLASDLGKRDKAKRVAYVDHMIKMSFDNLEPMVPIDEAILELAKQLAEKRKGIPIERAVVVNPFQGPLFDGVPDPDYDWTRPPGLLGDISNFVYQASPRPVKEVALGAAIAIMAGICGRAYNVSNTGLNQYILILAKTGIGKEAARSGIDKLTQAIRPKVPGIMEFVGPADISSGQALIRYLGKHQCFVSIVGEFGLMLEGMHTLSANPSQLQLKRKLLDLYNKSGHSDTLRETIYADTKNNTETVRSPAFTLFGESTPETFYRSIDDSMIQDGLLPRFMSIEYLGQRPPRNDNSALAVPSPELMQKLSDLAAQCLAIGEHNRVINVKYSPETAVEEKLYDKECDKHINSSEQVVTRELWNRAWLKTMKVASLIAIGENIFEPTISIQAFTWAKQLVERDILNVLAKFESGKAGKESSEVNQINELVEGISVYIKKSYLVIKGYSTMPEMHRDGVIPYSYLQRRYLSQNAFKNDRAGASHALDRTIRSLVDDGSIRELRATDILTRYNRKMKCYIVSDTSRF
jgi:hypothetical protein